MTAEQPPGERGHGATGRRIADELRAAILGGTLPPGTRVRQEELAERFRASRVPVRDALRMLEADGLVTVVPNTGAWVSHLRLVECEEMYRMRERLEPLLLTMSIPALGPRVEQIARLAQQMETTDDVEQFLRLDREFHLLSYAGAETSVLGDTVKRLWNTTQHYRRAYTLMLDPVSRRILHDEHHMLVEAIRSADAEDAERVLEGHIRRTRLRLALHPEAFSPEPTPMTRTAS